MGWKNWPSWLRGGIIISSVYILLLLWVFIGAMGINLGTNLATKFSANIFMLPVFLIFSLFKSILKIGDLAILIISAFLSIILYFIIGALIGLIVGKIKRGKKRK